MCGLIMAELAASQILVHYEKARGSLTKVPAESLLLLILWLGHYDLIFEQVSVVREICDDWLRVKL